ncbi:MAG: tyrosine-type recombinase/integrase [Acidobacteriota bacterium]
MDRPVLLPRDDDASDPVALERADDAWRDSMASLGPAAWDPCIDQFLSGARYPSRNTREAYRRALHRFADFAEGHGVSPDRISAALLEAYGRDLAEWDRAPRTKSQHIGAVRAFVGWLGVWFPMPGPAVLKRILPFPTVGRPSVNVPPRDLQRQMLDEALSTRDRLILELAVSCGLRASELARLRAESFHEDLDGNLVVEILGKGAKERPVPVPAHVALTYLAYLAETGRSHPSAGFLFQAVDRAADARGTEGLSRQTIRRIVVDAAGAADGRRIGPHALRHAAALGFLEAGGDAAALKNLLGHASLNTTQVYVDHRRLKETRRVLERALKSLIQGDDGG